MDLDQTMIIAGIGCRKGARAADIEAAITAALARAGVVASELHLVATSAAKGGEPGIAAAAVSVGVPLVLIPQRDLEAAGERTMTRSERVIAIAGVPSVAESAALAAGGPDARLIAPRVALGSVTCALVETGNALAHDATARCREGSATRQRDRNREQPISSGGGERRRAICESPAKKGEAP
jgi:cobalt-precorrin 5A hydrolase